MDIFAVFIDLSKEKKDDSNKSSHQAGDQAEDNRDTEETGLQEQER